MNPRVLAWLVIALMIFGTVSSMPAVSSQHGSGNHQAVRVVLGRTLHHDRWSTSPPPVESLELPRPGLAFEPPDPRLHPSEVSAAAAVLMDATTGELLFTRNPDEVLPPASITKILTALVVLERGHLSDAVVVSQAAASVGGYRLGLRRGQRISLNDLLAAILIRSANDAAAAAAEHVGHGLSGFVALMNAKAQELGMQHSHFANPHGLDEPGHYTTARDMAILTRVAMEHPDFARLVRTREVTVTIWKPGRRGFARQTRVIQTHNKLLGRLEGADGVKTGYTDAAGRCLVASASRGGQRMIAVLLNDRQRWTDAATLLRYGFESAGSAARMGGSPHPWRAARGGVGRG